MTRNLLMVFPLLIGCSPDYNPNEIDEPATELPYVEGDGSDDTSKADFLELCYSSNPCAKRWNPDEGDYDIDPGCNGVVEEPLEAIGVAAEGSILTLENLLSGGIDFTVLAVRAYKYSLDDYGLLEIDSTSFFIAAESYNEDWSFADAVDSWVNSKVDSHFLYGVLSSFPTDNINCQAKDARGTFDEGGVGMRLETGFAYAHASDYCSLLGGVDPADCMYVGGYMPHENDNYSDYLIKISASGETTHGSMEYTEDDIDYPVQDTVITPFEDAFDSLLRTGTTYAYSGKIIRSSAYDHPDGDFSYTLSVSVHEDRFEPES